MNIRPEITLGDVKQGHAHLTELQQRKQQLLGFSETQDAFRRYQFGPSPTNLNYHNLFADSNRTHSTKRKPRPKQIKRKRHKPTRR